MFHSLFGASRRAYKTHIIGEFQVLYMYTMENNMHKSIIYSKTAIQAVKKGAAKSGSPTQGEKVVKSRWQPRNGCDGQSMAKNLNSNNSSQFVLPHPSFTRNQHKIHLNRFY